MSRSILIVGGGTAGWITAAYLARTLGANASDGVRITLVESADIGILGVGEGTFPTIRKTLHRIGVDEAELVRECSATFKQGARFAHWRFEPGGGQPDHYLHSFQTAQVPGGLDLLPYWLLGVAGTDVNWDEVNTPQKRVADAHRAPKLITHENYAGALNYAFHLDAVQLARFLRRLAVGNGVTHVVDTVDAVELAEDGSIQRLKTRAHGDMSADLYVDCTGFRAQLIGAALKVPYKSCRDILFCDRALAIQVPYERSDSPIPSYTISTAQEAGWTWDIGLHSRRGIGHVYSSAHSTRERAEEVLRSYIGPRSADLEVREIPFEGGYRETNWYKNCIAIGLSSGFFEPLEATGIIFVEVAAVMLSNLFPWGGEIETAARQYNAIMLKRYERARDFIKMHYSLTSRRDSDFWRDNAEPLSSADSLHELLDRWRYRPPGPIDIEQNVDLFTESSWQYVLYGMGFKTDLSARAGALRYYDDARKAFESIQDQVNFALRTLPSNRQLIEEASGRRFGAQRTGDR
jgi:glycine/D-amino acid oxidase-like deaminating enzyme